MDNNDIQDCLTCGAVYYDRPASCDTCRATKAKAVMLPNILGHNIAFDFAPNTMDESECCHKCAFYKEKSEITTYTSTYLAKKTIATCLQANKIISVDIKLLLPGCTYWQKKRSKK